LSTKPALDEVDLWVVGVGAKSVTLGQVLGTSASIDPLVDVDWKFAATTAEERERASRFRNPDDAQRFLSAHGALRLILARYLARDPLTLRFSTGAWGKPALEDEALQFNLSHSGEFALIAVAHTRRVGVDVEVLRAIPDRANLIARVCSTGERTALDSLDPHEQDGAFLAMWTRKEALAKMTGEGVGALARDVRSDEQGGCKLVPLRDLPGYAGCVAAEGTTWRLVRRS
jgi:4'-phosphopantetheinyl transferase